MIIEITSIDKSGKQIDIKKITLEDAPNILLRDFKILVAHHANLVEGGAVLVKKLEGHIDFHEAYYEVVDLNSHLDILTERCDTPKYMVWSGGNLLIATATHDDVVDAILDDYREGDVCFGEYIEQVVIKASVENTLNLLGELYHFMENDLLLKINLDEDTLWDYSENEIGGHQNLNNLKERLKVSA